MKKTVFSVIMPSYLGNYRNAAANRDKKIVRAINSVLAQSFQDFELVIVADGCEKTVRIVKRNYEGKTGKIKLLEIAKATKFSGIPRNAGIQNANGEYIIYLDIDDVYLVDHLRIVHAQIVNHPDMDWFYFNDLSYNVNRTGTFEQNFDEHHIEIDKQGRCGTSNICHRRDMNVYWAKEKTYLHDWVFIGRLKAKSSKSVRLENTPQYGICHVPNLLDV